MLIFCWTNASCVSGNDPASKLICLRALLRLTHRSFIFLQATKPLFRQNNRRSRIQRLKSMSHTKINARIGLWLFTIYLVIYVLFVTLNAFYSEAMETTPFAGVNVAILFGFALIIAAFVLALLYGFLCKPEPHAESTNDSKDV